jgi:DNA-binding CsgD family transcriptional regulator
MTTERRRSFLGRLRRGRATAETAPAGPTLPKEVWASLSPDERQAVQLAQAGKTPRQIANRLGIRPDRARKLLRAAMATEPEGGEE